METTNKLRAIFSRIDEPRSDINKPHKLEDTEQFEACFVDWISHLVNLTDGEIIPIDGKTIRGGKSQWGKVALLYGK